MQKDQIIEELATGRMSRRQFNQKLIALGATMVTIPLGSKMANAGSDDHPTVFTWEGWEVPELSWAPFILVRRRPKKMSFTPSKSLIL